MLAEEATPADELIKQIVSPHIVEAMIWIKTPSSGP